MQTTTELNPTTSSSSETTIADLNPTELGSIKLTPTNTTSDSGVSSSDTVKVQMVVDGKPITIEVDTKDAPITADNFVDLVDRGVYDDTMFHRVEKDPKPFVVQGGDPESKNPDVPAGELGTGGFIDPETNQVRNIPLEIKPQGDAEPIYSKTFDEAGITVPPALPHTRGAIAMARSQAPDSASSQFYFALDDLPQLDGNYAVFGYVTDGMDIVDSIAKGDRIDYVAVTDGMISSRDSDIVTDTVLINDFANVDGEMKVELFTVKSDEDTIDVATDPIPSTEPTISESDLTTLSDPAAKPVVESTNLTSDNLSELSPPLTSTTTSTATPDALAELPKDLPQNIKDLVAAELNNQPQGKARGLQNSEVVNTTTNDSLPDLTSIESSISSSEETTGATTESTTPSNADDNLDLTSSSLTSRRGLMAFKGNDKITGNAENNVFNGNQDQDIILGGDGNDFLRGGKGDDQLIGQAGDDYLVGDFGADILTGGAGADVFLLRGESSVGVTDPTLADVITDFTVNDGDRICLVGDFTASNVQYVLSGSDTLIKSATGDILGLVKNATTDAVSQAISFVSSNDRMMQIG